MYELSSDRSPIIATVDAHVLPRVHPPALTTQHTDWEEFRSNINAHITLNLRLKESQELDDAKHQFTTLLQNAAWQSTPPSRAPSSGTPLHIRDLVLEKRRSHSQWQRSHNQCDRAIYNRLKRKLQTALRDTRNANFAHFLTSLSPDDSSLCIKVLNDPRFRLFRSGIPMTAGPRVTKRRLGHLRLTSARFSGRNCLPFPTILWSLIP